MRETGNIGDASFIPGCHVMPGQMETSRLPVPHIAPHLELVLQCMFEALEVGLDGPQHPTSKGHTGRAALRGDYWENLAWFKSKETRPFSFRWCCDMLDALTWESWEWEQVRVHVLDAAPVQDRPISFRVEPTIVFLPGSGEHEKGTGDATCHQCGGLYWRHRRSPWQRYCSQSCRRRGHVLAAKARRLKRRLRAARQICQQDRGSNKQRGRKASAPSA